MNRWTKRGVAKAMASWMNVRGVVWAGVAAGLVSLAGTPAAFAQVQNVPGHYAVVVADGELRSGEGERFYTIAEVKAGHVFLVDGESQTWSRVNYPSTVGVFVRAEDLTVEGEQARLSAPSRLLAPHRLAGFGGSWKSLMNADLPAGTMFKVLESVRDSSTGPIVAYRVAPPTAARAFVPSRLLRRASDAEVAAFRARGGVLPDLPASATPTAPAPTTPAPAPAPAGQETTPGAAPSPMPGAAGDAPGTPPANPTSPSATPPAPPPASAPAPATDLTQPIVAPTPGDQPAPQQPAGTPPTGTTPPANPTSPSAAPAEPARPAGPEALEAKFRAVWAQPLLQGEYDELMAEFERSISSMPEGSRARRGLEQRVEAMRLRLETRERLRRMEENRAKLDSDMQRVRQQIAQWEASRDYTIVGVIQPSTVYDGQSLPLMFRVVSVGGSAPRTLGYLRPNEKFNLVEMVGLVVGVIGEANVDRSLQLNVIDPVRVDILRPGAGGQPGTVTPVPEQAQPAEGR